MSRDMSISICYTLLQRQCRYNDFVYMHIGVGSALLVSINRVMRRPLERETSNRYRFSRFFFFKPNTKALFG